MNVSERTWPFGPQVQRTLVSFDGSVVMPAATQKPDRYAFFRCSDAARVAIARGAGLSYAAASFGHAATTIDLTAFDRMLDFDTEGRRVRVEAGMTLAALYWPLAAKGFFLPVQPGHGRITIGGCIAADAHGKNQAQDGTFFGQVESLRLFHPKHGILDISLECEPDLFRLTCGGYGLTGIILDATLRLRLLPSRTVETSVYPVKDTSHGIRELGRLALENDFAYSWHDFTRRDPGFGRGHVTAGHFVAAASTAPETTRFALPSLSSEGRRKLPLALLNRWTTRAMNAAYQASRLRERTSRRAHLDQCLFPIHGSEVYFSLFGHHGFHEYQAILPHDRFVDYIDGLRGAAEGTRTAIALASAKLFGGRQELLRFTGSGICFAVNVPRNPGALKFLEQLDVLVIELGGRPNIIKDSRLPRAVMEATYPECDQFRSLLQRWDPDRLFRSELSERLAL